MGKQVDSDYYFKKKYLTLERFISYFYQIKSVRDTISEGKILFIGPGDNVVPDYLKKGGKYEIVTFDIDQDLNPDVVGDVRDLKFEENEFDLVVAFEVLEHVEYKYFVPILEQFKKISKNKVLISIPYRVTSFEFVFKFPGIRSLLKRDYLRASFDIPLKFPGIEVSTQHYWEIDNSKTKFSKVKKDVSSVFNIKNIQRPVLDRYHTFFSLYAEKESLNSEFVKEYYNESLKGLDEDYSKYRWHRNPESKFDYYQTKKTLNKIVNNLKFKSVIEIGPGDGAWTEFFVRKADKYTVLDQSTEMLNRLKNKFSAVGIDYIESDFLKYNPDAKYDGIFAIRCFEYFDDKKASLEKMYSMLENNSIAVITTKNPNYIRSAVSDKKLHSKQIGLNQMINEAKESGFEIKKIYPTTLRVKSKYAISRFVFKTIFNFGLLINSKLFNKIFDWATESYTYVLQKK